MYIKIVYYKILTKEINEDKLSEEHTVFIDQKIQHRMHSDFSLLPYSCGKNHWEYSRH